MKLISRIKAAQPLLVKPGPVVEVKEPTFPPPPTPITATHGPYGIEIGAPEKTLLDVSTLSEKKYLNVDTGKIENVVKDSMADALAKLIDEDFVSGPPAQTAAKSGGLLSTSLLAESMLKKLKSLPTLTEVMKSKNADTFLHFPNQASKGEIVGVWRARLVAVDMVYATSGYRVVLEVEGGPESGKHITLSVGDSLTVNHKISTDY